MGSKSTSGGSDKVVYFLSGCLYKLKRNVVIHSFLLFINLSLYLQFKFTYMEVKEMLQLKLSNCMSVTQFVEITGESRQNIFTTYVRKGQVDTFIFETTKENGRDQFLIICNDKLLNILQYLESKRKRKSGGGVINIVEKALKSFEFIKG